MAHHIGIGEVQHNQIMGAAFDCRHGFVGQFGRRHFRLQIIGRDILGRWYHDAFLAGIDRFFATIQEEGDMRVFFRLRHAQLLEPRTRDDFAKLIHHGLRREGGGEMHVQGLAILREADSGSKTRQTRARKPIKTRIEQRG